MFSKAALPSPRLCRKAQSMFSKSAFSSMAPPGGADRVLEGSWACREARNVFSNAICNLQAPPWGAECVFKGSFASSRPPPYKERSGTRLRTRSCLFQRLAGKRGARFRRRPPAQDADRDFESSLPHRGAECVFEGSPASTKVPPGGAERVFESYPGSREARNAVSGAFCKLYGLAGKCGTCYAS